MCAQEMLEPQHVLAGKVQGHNGVSKLSNEDFFGPNLAVFAHRGIALKRGKVRPPGIEPGSI